MQNYHKPVLLEEVIESLAPAEGKQYIDCTFGGGGHSRVLLEAGATVLGIDQDDDALNHAQPLLDKFPDLTVVKSNFDKLGEIAKAQKIDSVEGILMDLGVSSWQLDTIERGFSFQGEAPLDMRMDKELSVQAKDLIAALGEKELALLFFKYGGESQSKKIAKAIVHARKHEPILTTMQLATLVEKNTGGRRSKLHPATKVFQALRIAVNDELVSLEKTLPQAVALLKPKAVLAVISFHEGEDRIVKQFIKNQVAQGVLDQVIKPITPSPKELASNPRARSAKLRVARKTYYV